MALALSSCVANGGGTTHLSNDAAAPVTSSPPPSASSQASSNNASLANSPRGRTFVSAKRLATLDNKAITESSGIVASRTNPDLFWTHNDSDKKGALYLVDRQGRTRGVWVIPNVKPNDWEDIAAGPGAHAGSSYLYIGDIGDNTARRREIVVHRIPEPVLPDNALSNSTHQTAAAESFRLRYPDGARDAETLLVHPMTGDLYIVTKQALAPAKIYRAPAPLDARRTTTLARIANLEIPSPLGGFITGGDISPDGRRVALCDYVAAYEFSLPAGASNFDAIWRESASIITLNPRAQGEAICYRLDGNALLTTSEGAASPLDEIVRSDAP